MFIINKPQSMSNSTSTPHRVDRASELPFELVLALCRICDHMIYRLDNVSITYRGRFLSYFKHTVTNILSKRTYYASYVNYKVNNDGPGRNPKEF